MSSFWDGNYFYNQYSNDAWEENDANEEEEVVSGVPVNQKIQLPDLNEAPTPPVNEPYYPGHQVYPDHGYGFEPPYVQQDNLHGYVGYGVENAPISDPYYPTQQSYPDYGYGGEDYHVQEDSGYGGYGGCGDQPPNTPLYDDYEPSTPGIPFQNNMVSLFLLKL